MLLLLVLCCLFAPSTARTYSTHTPYDFVRGDIRLSSWEDDLTPQKIYLLARHGSRHFSKDTIQMNIVVDKLLANNVPRDFEWMQGWERPVYISDYDLVEQGMLEHYHMAQRYRDRFPELLPAYYAANYSIRATYKRRTSQSASAFLYGLFEGEGPLSADSTRDDVKFTGYQPTAIEIFSRDDDTLLRAMDNCPKYTYSNVTLSKCHNSDMLVTSSRFKEAVTTPISDILGFEMTSDDIIGLYNLCAFEVVSPTQAGFSRFCEMIPEGAFEYLEYEHDMAAYYSTSYPNRIGYEISCNLLVDILKQFSSDHVTTLRFAHAETVTPLVTLLGLFKEDDVDQWSWDTPDFENRKFNFSQAIPFASNLAFVLFEQESSADLVIKVYLNENEIRIPACISSEYGCTISEIEQIISSTEDSCDFTKMCHLPGIQDHDENDVTATDNDVTATDNDVRDMFKDTLQAENMVAVNLVVFVALVCLSGLSCLLCGFIVVNRSKIFGFDFEGVERGGSPLSYQKMPFLDS